MQNGNIFDSFFGVRKNLADMRSNRTKNALEELQLKYAPQQFEDEQLGRQLRNQEAQTQLKYLAPYLSSRNQGQQYQNALSQLEMLYKPAEYKNKNALAQAQLARTQLETQMLPEEFQLKRDQLKQQQNRFGDAYRVTQFLSAMPSAERSTWIANNADYLNQIGLQGLVQAGQTLGIPYNVQGAATQIPGLPNAPTTEQSQQLQSAAQQATNKALTTTATQQQIEGGQQLMEVLNSPTFKEQMEAASQYASVAGKGKAALDAWSNKNQDNLIKARTFKDTTLPLIGNRIKQLDGMSSDIEGRKELHRLYAQAYSDLSTNPQRFKQTFSELKKTLQTIESAVARSGEKVFKTNKVEGNQEGYGGYTADEIKAYAKKSGLTPAEVVELMKQKGVK